MIVRIHEPGQHDLPAPIDDLRPARVQVFANRLDRGTVDEDVSVGQLPERPVADVGVHGQHHRRVPDQDLAGLRARFRVPRLDDDDRAQHEREGEQEDVERGVTSHA